MRYFRILLDFYNRMMILSIGWLYGSSYYRDGELLYAVLTFLAFFILAKVHYKKCYVYSVTVIDENNQTVSRTVESFDDEEEVIEDIELFDDDVRVTDIKVEKEKMKFCLGRIFDY